MTSGSSTLRARFDRLRPALERTLPPRCAAEVATAVVHDLLATLRQETEAETPERMRHVAQVHELLRATVTGTLLAIRGTGFSPPPPAPASRPGWHLPVGPVRISVSPRQQRNPYPEASHHQPPPRPTPLPVWIDSVALLDQLAGACDAVDRILSATPAPAPAPPEPPPWAQDTELTELFQDLLAAASQRDGRLALLQIERLRGVLALRHGIATVEFSEDHQDLFALAPPPDPPARHDRPDLRGSSAWPDYSTVRPALVAKARSDGTPARVLLRGEARGPLPPPPDGAERNGPPVPRDEPHV